MWDVVLLSDWEIKERKRKKSVAQISILAGSPNFRNLIWLSRFCLKPDAWMIWDFQWSLVPCDSNGRLPSARVDLCRKSGNSLLLPCATASEREGKLVQLLSAFCPRLLSGCWRGDDDSIAVACEGDAVDGNAALRRITAAATISRRCLKKLNWWWWHDPYFHPLPGRQTRTTALHCTCTFVLRFFDYACTVLTNELMYNY
jgi:hypothetical protein